MLEEVRSKESVQEWWEERSTTSLRDGDLNISTKKTVYMRLIVGPT